VAANVETGRTRMVRYCGTDYTVSPGEVYGRKQLWVVAANGVTLTATCPTRSKAAHRIHAHATETAGTYPAQIADGLAYGQLVSRLCG
jgi:hypothetical protein